MSTIIVNATGNGFVNDRTGSSFNNQVTHDRAVQNKSGILTQGRRTSDRAKQGYVLVNSERPVDFVIYCPHSAPVWKCRKVCRHIRDDG